MSLGFRCLQLLCSLPFIIICWPFLLPTPPPRIGCLSIFGHYSKKYEQSHLILPSGEKGSSHPFNSGIWGRQRPTAGSFRCADWRSGDSLVIGWRFMAPMKTPLARAIRFFARRSAHTAPCFLSRWLPPAPLPSNVLEDGFRAKRARADTRACATHPF